MSLFVGCPSIAANGGYMRSLPFFKVVQNLIKNTNLCKQNTFQKSHKAMTYITC